MTTAKTKKPTKKQLDKEQLESCLRWHYVALCFGYMELSKKGKNLGDRLYFRMAAAQAERDFQKAGGELELQEKGLPTLVLRDHMPHLKLSHMDVEMVRKFIADMDEPRRPDDDAPEELGPACDAEEGARRLTKAKELKAEYMRPKGRR